MTSTRGTAWDISIDLDQLQGASLMLLPIRSDGGINVYPDWAPELVQQLRAAGVSVAWATKKRAYMQTFSAEVEAAVQVAMLLTEPVTQAGLALVVDFLRSLIMPKSGAAPEIRARFATEVDPKSGKVTDYSELIIPVDHSLNAEALLDRFSAARVAGIKAVQGRD